jgi:hypothetical protein
MPPTEAGTRAEYIDPMLNESKWGHNLTDGSQVLREFYFTDGRMLAGGQRGKRKFADYILSYKNQKLAIIEADIMLDTMLTKIGYDGNTVAEKLKNVEESDFVTLQKAWEAHKVRNRIAHDGSKFKISRGEAERVVNLFEQVFKEFYYI